MSVFPVEVLENTRNIQKFIDNTLACCCSIRFKPPPSSALLRFSSILFLTLFTCATVESRYRLLLAANEDGSLLVRCFSNMLKVALARNAQNEQYLA